MLKRQERKRRYYYTSIRYLSIRAGFISVVALLVFSAAAWLYVNFSETAVPVSVSPVTDHSLYVESWWPNWREVLFSGIPGIAEQRPAVQIKTEITAQNILRSTVMVFTGIDIQDVRSLFHAEIPLLATLKAGPSTVSAMSLPNFPKFEAASKSSDGKPLVGIYHTHTAESFIPNSGAAHKPGGQIGDIVAVGEALVKRLNQHGIPALQSKNIHDYPSFMKAYNVSEITLQKMLAENPSLQMIFDIHRDAAKREDVTTTINGLDVAKITIVVATGQPDLVQPHWQQNHAFAKLIDAKLNQEYPGLSRGIQLVDWRYNQHLHPRALLLEVGSQESSKEEAERSMEMLGDILAEIIAENR